MFSNLGRFSRNLVRFGRRCIQSRSRCDLDMPSMVISNEMVNSLPNYDDPFAYYVPRVSATDPVVMKDNKYFTGGDEDWTDTCIALAESTFTLQTFWAPNDAFNWVQFLDYLRHRVGKMNLQEQMHVTYASKVLPKIDQGLQTSGSGTFVITERMKNECPDYISEYLLSADHCFDEQLSLSLLMKLSRDILGEYENTMVGVAESFNMKTGCGALRKFDLERVYSDKDQDIGVVKIPSSVFPRKKLAHQLVLKPWKKTDPRFYDKVLAAGSAGVIPPKDSKGRDIDEAALKKITRGEVYLSVMTKALLEYFKESNTNSSIKDVHPLIVKDEYYGDFKCSHILGFGNSGTVMSVKPFEVFGVFTHETQLLNENQGNAIPKAVIDAINKDFFKD